MIAPEIIRFARDRVEFCGSPVPLCLRPGWRVLVKCHLPAAGIYLPDRTAQAVPLDAADAVTQDRAVCRQHDIVGQGLDAPVLDKLE